MASKFARSLFRKNSTFRQLAPIAVGFPIGYYAKGYYTAEIPRPNVKQFFATLNGKGVVKPPSLRSEVPQPSSTSKPYDPSKDERPAHPFSTGDTIFAFGPASKYFLATRQQKTDEFDWRAYKEHGSLISSQLHGARAIYYFAYTPHGDELLAYDGTNVGAPTWLFRLSPYRSSHAPTYSSLLKWMRMNMPAEEAALRKSFVVFGPGASCFARNENACFWQDLPQRLENVLLEKKANHTTKEGTPEEKAGWIPRILALGIDETYIAVWEDGRRLCSLKSDHEMLSWVTPDNANEVAPEEWENIVLDPHDGEHYFAIEKSGTVIWNTPIGSSMDPNFKFPIQLFEFMQLRAKENGQTFEFEHSRGENKTSSAISPETNWTAATLEKLFTKTSYTIPVETDWIPKKLRKLFTS